MHSESVGPRIGQGMARLKPSRCFAIGTISMQGKVVLGGLRACGRMLGTLAQALTLVRPGFFPKRPSDLDRVDP